MVYAHLFCSVYTTKYKYFSIQCRRARLINFCVVVYFEFKIFSDTTLKEINPESFWQKL